METFHAIAREAARLIDGSRGALPATGAAHLGRRLTELAGEELAWAVRSLAGLALRAHAHGQADLARELLRVADAARPGLVQHRAELSARRAEAAGRTGTQRAPRLGERPPPGSTSLAMAPIPRRV